MQQMRGTGPRRRPENALWAQHRAQSTSPRPRRRRRSRGPSHPRALDSQVLTLSLDLAPSEFCMRVRLEETGEIFRIPNCHSDMTVRELKEELDLMVGVPFNLQYLHYLDKGILLDHTTLKFHDVVPGGIISLCIWHYDGWTELVLAAAEGDPIKVASCLGLGREEGPAPQLFQIFPVTL
ncbi:ankyrin repeat domain-containing protein 60 isoform 2-T2 [Thomomys bottae]